jgi:hypothetical protein
MIMAEDDDDIPLETLIAKIDFGVSATDRLCAACSNLGIKTLGELIRFLDPPIAKEDFLQERINSIDFCVRVKNAFCEYEFVTVADLVNMTEQELLRVPNMGGKSVNKIKEVLAEHGLALSSDKDRLRRREHALKVSARWREEGHSS